MDSARGALFILLFAFGWLAYGSWAECSSLQPCTGSKVHYLFVYTDDELSSTADQAAIAAFARETGAGMTVAGPDQFNAVAADKTRTTYLGQLLSNLKEIHRKINLKKERDLESYLYQRDRTLEEIHSLEAPRTEALHEILPPVLHSIRTQSPGSKLVLVFAGHGMHCSDGKGWCSELVPGQFMSENDWVTVTQANGAIFDSNFMVNGMELASTPGQNRIYASTKEFWDRDEAGSGLISAAMIRLLQSSPQEACAADLDRDGKITLAELGAFLSAAYTNKKVAGKIKGDDICIARTAVKTCTASRATLAKGMYERLFKHAEVLPPVPRQRGPASAKKK
jgi:hypothetical protein